MKIIPHHIVLEFLGHVSFCTNAEADLSITEQIASQTYNSMDQLISTCRGEIRVGRHKRNFESFVKRLPESTFFKPYMS